MKRLKIKDLRIKILVLILLLIFINHKSLFINPVFAANSTPSADIKSKLEELKREIASKAAVLKLEVDKKLQNKAYIGKIKTKSDSTLTIASKNGPRIININQDTEFISTIKGKKYSQKLLGEEDYIATLGDIDENQVLTAKKIILLNPIPNILNPKIYLWGQVVVISDEQSSSSSKLVTIKGKDLKNVSVSLSNQKVKLNDFVILTGTKNKNEIFEADFVYIIPKGGFLKSKKVATPTAQIATKSATPSAKKK